MSSRNPLIDAYIGKSAEFAKPILEHLRDLVHKACPDVEERIKWGFPHFDYKGMFCHMAAFKQHCVFGFWKESLMKDPHGIVSARKNDAMGSLGRVTSLSDLPSDKQLIAYIKDAMDLNDRGIPLPTIKKDTPVFKKKLEIPDYIHRALIRNRKTREIFEDFSYSNKKDYVEWITEAKTEKTRKKRISTMLEWVAEGKPRNWRYMKKTKLR
jgi:uncharacterized protein YdeI (YjbR/CyaY-like superfamily)